MSLLGRYIIHLFKILACKDFFNNHFNKGANLYAIKEYSITNYRSITVAKSIVLNIYSVILGKNNEGKTNVLNAINLAMTTLQNSFHRTHIIGNKDSFSPKMISRMDLYDFHRDYPVSLQSDEKADPTRLILKFILNEEDKIKFLKSVGSAIMAVYLLN